MNVLAFATDNKRSVSLDWLIGLTVGGYAILSIALYFFGGGTWISSGCCGYDVWDFPPPGQLQAFYLVVPGLLIGWLDFVQVHSEAFFKHQANERITSISVCLNAAAILGLFASIPLKSMTGAVAGYLQMTAIIGAALSFCAGILTGALHVSWMVAKGRTKHGRPSQRSARILAHPEGGRPAPVARYRLHP